MNNHPIALVLFLTALPAIGFSLNPLPKVAKENWPKHDPPIHLHGAFDVPDSVWRVHGGHFIAYDAGEWGGALFFQSEGTEHLKLLLKDHVSSLARFENGSYVAAGGLAHGLEHGSVYIVGIDDDLKWNSRNIFTTRKGIPSVVWTEDFESARIEVVETIMGIEKPDERITIAAFTVFADGRLEYLGQPKQNEAANKPADSTR